MPTPNLNIDHVLVGQGQKHVTVNEGLDALDKATQGATAITITGTYAVSAAELRGGFSLELTGTPGAAFDLNVPAIRRSFRVSNGTDGPATVQVTGGAGASVEVPAGAAAFLYCDGADVTEEGGGAATFPGLTDTPAAYTGQKGKVPAVKTAEDGLEFKATPYDIPVVKGPTPTANEVIARFTLARDVDFPADFASSPGTVETNPDATFDIDVQDDGVSIGTVSISTGGAYTFTTAGNSAKKALAGSKLEFIGPDPADASIEGISFSLRASTVDL